MYEETTIAAIATPPGEGGVAIVRISGMDAEKITARIFHRMRKGSTGQLESHRLYHGQIHDPRSGRVLDEVLLTIMRNPRSYTGEDVVEIHCHGGAFVVKQILALILTEGARQAEAAEYAPRGDGTTASTGGCDGPMTGFRACRRMSPASGPGGAPTDRKREPGR